MGGDSICALADRLGESELGSGPRLRKESVVRWVGARGVKGRKVSGK